MRGTNLSSHAIWAIRGIAITVALIGSAGIANGAPSSQDDVSTSLIVEGVISNIENGEDPSYELIEQLRMLDPKDREDAFVAVFGPGPDVDPDLLALTPYPGDLVIALRNLDMQGAAAKIQDASRGFESGTRSLALQRGE